MTCPSLAAAAARTGASTSVLIRQFQRLEHDTGTTLYHRAATGRPWRLTPRGRALQRPGIASLMTAGAKEPATTPRKPTPREEELAFYATITARQIRITKPTRATLRVLLAASDKELHGLEISDRAGLTDGTIYPLLARLREAGWITSERESHASWLARNPPGQKQHPRRRNHQLTSHGRQAALRELARPGRQCP